MGAQKRHWLGHQLRTWIRCVAWSPDGARLVGGGDDGRLFMWDAATGSLMRELTGHQGVITSVAWHGDGRQVASGGGGRAGGELFVWDAQSGERIRAFSGFESDVSAVAWDQTGNLLVTGGNDGTLRWWDAQSGQGVRARSGHRGTIRALKMRPDGTRVASCGDDGAIMLWNLDTGEHVRTLRRDRPYERLDITGIHRLTEAQLATLRALGAIEKAGLSTP